MEKPSFAKGLEGVIASESTICVVDGQKGKLYYRGYSVQDLAEHSNFEEVTYLLLYDKLPTSEEMALFSKKMRKSRALSEPILAMIHAFPAEAHPMELLQSVVAYLSGYTSHRIEHSLHCNCRDTLHQVVQLGSVVAAYARHRAGQEYVEPNLELSHGGNFLYMLHGKEPDPLEARIMDTILILHAEHGFNASTFTARVVASTLSTCYASISSAIGSLAGPLHGGANERVIEMIEEIGDKSQVDQWLEKALKEKRKVMGLGHRVYKVKDPRADIMEKFLIQLSERLGDNEYYEILKEIENKVNAKIGDPAKTLYPNVDFYSGAVYRLLGIEPILFTPLFAVSRVSGWLAHIIEQRGDNRLFRPKCLYIGPEPREYVPMDKRE